MRRIVIASQKGGVAKSTTATCLAVALARRGKRILLVDCDAQANATWTITAGRLVEPPTLAAVLMRQVAAEDAIWPTSIPGLELLPADASLNSVNVTLAQELGRDARLRSAMAPLDERWDFVILDTAPSVTTILANALVYGSEVIVPVDPGVYAMLGLVQIQRTIEEVREAYGNPSLHLAGLVLTKVSRNNVSRDVEAELRSRFGDRVFRAVVPLSARVEEAHTRGQTVMEHAPKSAAAVAYGELAGEVLSYGGTEDGGGGASVGRARKVKAAGRGGWADRRA